MFRNLIWKMKKDEYMRKMKMYKKDDIWRKMMKDEYMRCEYVLYYTERFDALNSSCGWADIISYLLSLKYYRVSKLI